MTSRRRALCRDPARVPRDDGAHWESDERHARDPRGDDVVLADGARMAHHCQNSPPLNRPKPKGDGFRNSRRRLFGGFDAEQALGCGEAAVCREPGVYNHTLGSWFQEVPEPGDDQNDLRPTYHPRTHLTINLRECDESL